MTRFLLLSVSVLAGLLPGAAVRAGAADTLLPGLPAAMAPHDIPRAVDSAASAHPVPNLTAAQIIDRNVAARGGLEAWRKVQTMMLAGHIETARGSQTTLPFVLEIARPNKTHFEIDVRNQRSVRVYDGREGWKMRAVQSSPPELQPFSPQELRYASDAQVVDGVLIDHEAKGISVVAEGIDQLDGRVAYRLSAHLPSGALETVWVDAETFLEVRSQREFHNQANLTGRTTMYYSDFRDVDGLKLPFLVETASGTGQTPDKLIIEKVSLNLPFDERTFSRPHTSRVRETRPQNAAAGAR
jgi:hypothetical protein